jgi:hypothetical protein
MYRQRSILAENNYASYKQVALWAEERTNSLFPKQLPRHLYVQSSSIYDPRLLLVHTVLHTYLFNLFLASTWLLSVYFSTLHSA